MHSEGQLGKGLVDVHFAVGLRQFNSYDNKEGKDNFIPLGIVRAMEWNGGIVSSTAELVSIQHAYQSTMVWVKAKNSRSLSRAGTIHEIAYEAVSNGFVASA